MVNNAGSERRDKNGEKHGTERQKLADELSFLAGLISKHKEKPAVKKSAPKSSGYNTNQFSWTKQGQRSHNPHYLPTKESLSWKKSKERSEDHVATPATRYKYVAEDVKRFQVGRAIERSKSVSCAKVEANVCKEEKISVATSTGQCPVPKEDVQARRIVIPQQGNNLLLLKSQSTPSEECKVGLSSRKPTSAKPEVIGESESTEPGLASIRTISVTPELQGSSSESHRNSKKRRVVLPTSQKASVAGALKSLVNLDAGSGLSRNAGKETSVKLSSSLSKAQTCTSTKTLPEKPTGSQKGPTERPNAEVLATLSKELDKCLGDIARLKGARAQLKHGKSLSDGLVRKTPCVLARQTKSETNSEKNAAFDSNQRVRDKQGSSLKPNSANKKCKETEHEKSTTGSSAISAISDYKWVAPKVVQGKLSSAHMKAINKTKVESMKNTVKKTTAHDEIRTATNNLNTGFKASKQSPSQVNVIRTKYKMNKQLSTPSSMSLSSISRHKIDHRKVITPAVKLPVKTYMHKGSVKMNKYKLVKSFSHPGVVSIGQPSTSSSPQKMQVAVNSRYKKVKGYLIASGSPRESAIVIPHRSQLKLNRTKPKPDQTKQTSSSATTRKQSRHKIDRRPGGTAVVRSRFKMRKVSNRTPRKTPPKQSSNSSPFKWQAKKFTPSKPATADTFMRRRMRYVLTHTPVLLRTRFRLINSQQNNSTLNMVPKQPLLKKTRTKLVRKSASTPSSPSQKFSRSQVVNAKGVHYHQSRSGKSLRRISGSPVLPSSAHRTLSTSRFRQGSLSRVWTASVHKVYQRQGVTRVSSTQWVANRVLRRTIQGKIQRGNKNMKSQPYCKFYNRYGRCHRGDKCPYIHDPDKVAVCTQFLRGTCKKTDGSCPFSHKVSKDKMPVCVYFLKGVCNRDDCPYSHVKVSRKAEVCQEFLHGYCPRGAKCKKKHTLDCAEFNETGQCKLGNRCPLWHRGRKAKSEGRKGVKRGASEGEKVSSKRSNARDKHTGRSKHDAALFEDRYSKEDDDADSSETDDRSGSMPSFIALDSDSTQSTPEDSVLKKQPFIEDGGRPALKIRPLFAPSKGASTSQQGQGRDSSTSSSSLLKPSVSMATGCSSKEEDAHPSSDWAEFTTSASSPESAS